MKTPRSINSASVLASIKEGSQTMDLIAYDLYNTHSPDSKQLRTVRKLIGELEDLGLVAVRSRPRLRVRAYNDRQLKEFAQAKEKREQNSAAIPELLARLGINPIKIDFGGKVTFNASDLLAALKVTR